MKERNYNYTCTHSHENGHCIVFRWPHGIELLIDFSLGKGYILNRGDKRVDFSLDITLKEFEDKIDQCQQMDDTVAPFVGMTREQLVEMCMDAIDLEAIADHLTQEDMNPGKSSMEIVIGVGSGQMVITGGYFLRTEYNRHDDPERINPPEYTLALFEFYLEDDFKIEFFRDQWDE